MERVPPFCGLAGGSPKATECAILIREGRYITLLTITKREYVMKMTTKGRYALRAMLRLAISDRRTPTSLPQLSEMEEISAIYLNQLFFRLRRAGLVSAVRGPAGGFVLNRDPAEISVKDILDAVGEEIGIPTSRPGGAARCDSCDAQEGASNLWKGASEVVSGYFAQVTLQAILDDATNGVIGSLVAQ